MPNRGKIALVVAGGEIGMRYSERKNGHAPVVTAEEMLSWLPEEFTENVQLIDWSHQASSHYTVRMTTDLMKILSKLIVDGIQGIVVTCGTDALEEMAYLASLTWAYPQPVIFTGATHPSDMIGTDGPVNLYQSFLAARAQSSWGMGVLVCFQDQLFAASEITQIANYRRDAFSAIDRGPVGEIINEEVLFRRTLKREKVFEGIVPARNVELVYASLGGGERFMANLANETRETLDGLVIAAFGNGNVFPTWISHIRSLIKSNIPIVLTSKCPAGRTNSLYGFEGSASRLFEMGVLNGGALSPAKARLKLAVGIGAGLSKKELKDYIE